MNEQGKRVLILGASYGGLYCAKFLHDLVQKSMSEAEDHDIVGRTTFSTPRFFLSW